MEIGTLAMNIQNVTFVQEVVITFYRSLLLKMQFQEAFSQNKDISYNSISCKVQFLFGETMWISALGKESACAFLADLCMYLCLPLCATHSCMTLPVDRRHRFIFYLILHIQLLQKIDHHRDSLCPQCLRRL